MQLKLFKTLWGHDGPFQTAVQQAAAADFTGIEGPAPADPMEANEWLSMLADQQLEFIAEICTAGSYVPDRHASLQQHLDDFAEQLERSLPMQPLFVNCLGGADAWPEAQSIEFFSQAINMADHAGVQVSFETHRGRTLFNPWVTDRIASALPHIKLTCDYSHWCVVCERLVDTEQPILNNLARHAHHIHARVGYDQGPQVPHPGAPEYATALHAHQSWWEAMWQTQLDRGRTFTTMTPEFGPDGYLHHIPFSDEPVADLWELNCWIANEERNHITRWLNQKSQQNTEVNT
ncbi:MAG: TIM barrel protein [Pseudomonadota bacterium]